MAETKELLSAKPPPRDTFRKKRKTLTVGKQRIRISIVQRLRRGKLRRRRIPIRIIRRALDLGQVRRLMQHRGGAVLRMARRRDGRQRRVEERAVGDDGQAGHRVRQHVAAARAVDVGAVRVAGARRGGAALGRHVGEDGGHGRARRRRRRLEVLGHLGCGAGGRGGLRLGREGAAGGQGWRP